MADHFVIDGSNLATEGRTEPSLAQLKEAVAAFHGEHPGAVATVVVDASFEHRIDPSERAAFAKTEAAGEVVSPPAGAVGRGDGFLLQIADRTGGTVISNDSFQEFHAEYEWLFEPGRLIGGKPVPGVGWIFSLRRPVRGIVSRKTVQKAKQGGDKAERRCRRRSRRPPRARCSRTRRSAAGGAVAGRTGSSPTKVDDNKAEPEAVNEPASFLQFVIDHRLGTEVDGTVDAFASHGAFVIVDGVRCYVPLSAMGNPQPSRARDVLTKDETRTFVVQAVDAPAPGHRARPPRLRHRCRRAERGDGRGRGRPAPLEGEDGPPDEGGAARKRSAKKAKATAAAPVQPEAPQPADGARAGPRRACRARALSAVPESARWRRKAASVSPRSWKDDRRSEKAAAATTAPTKAKRSRGGRGRSKSPPTAPVPRRDAGDRQAAAPVMAQPGQGEGPGREEAGAGQGEAAGQAGEDHEDQRRRRPRPPPRRPRPPRRPPRSRPRPRRRSRPR